MTPCPVTSGDDFKLLTRTSEGMPSCKEIEKEIQKINKEITKLQWEVKNEVLNPHQKTVKKNKIKQLKKTRKDLMKQVEGWRVWKVSSQRQ